MGASSSSSLLITTMIGCMMIIIMIGGGCLLKHDLGVGVVAPRHLLLQRVLGSPLLSLPRNSSAPLPCVPPLLVRSRVIIITVAASRVHQPPLVLVVVVLLGERGASEVRSDVVAAVHNGDEAGVPGAQHEQREDHQGERQPPPRRTAATAPTRRHRAKILEKLEARFKIFLRLFAFFFRIFRSKIFSQ